MDRQQVDTALKAATLALSGRRRPEGTSFASIELRTVDSKTDRWEILSAAAVGVVAVIGVVVAWLY